MELGSFDALSFDCYGTLIDWESGIAAVLGPWARARGLDLDNEALLAAYSGHEARAEADHPGDRYPLILARSFRDLGRELGAEVTGVCSMRNAGLVRSIGAAHVVDYTTEDFTDGRARYDVILDNVGNRPLSRLRRAFTPAGTLVLNGGGSPGHVFGPVAGILRAVVVNGLVRERLRLIPHEEKREQLLTLTGLIEEGKLTPVLDRTYPLADTAEGLRRVEQGHARGKVVITVA